MNHDEFATTEALAAAWTVDPGDIGCRVAAAIGAPAPTDLSAELRALHDELRELRGATAILQREIIHLRRDLTHRAVTRLAPYAGSEALVRLS